MSTYDCAKFLWFPQEHIVLSDWAYNGHNTCTKHMDIRVSTIAVVISASCFCVNQEKM